MKRTVIIAGVVVAVLVAVVVVMAFVVPDDPVRASDDPDSPEAGWVALGPIEAPVESLAPIASEPDVYLGLAAPAPTFDTSQLGPDFSFDDSAPGPAILEEDAVRAVYLGKDIEGVEVFVYQQGSNNLWNLIGQIVLDRAVGRLGSTYECCTPGPAPEDGNGFPIMSLQTLNDGPQTLLAEWHALPEQVVAVAFRLDDEALGWQRVVGGSVAIRRELEQAADPSSIEYIALDEFGSTVATYPTS